VALIVDQLKPVNRKPGMGAKLHRGPPVAALAHIKLGTEEANDNVAHLF
jgi:hypothetical protein